MNAGIRRVGMALSALVILLVAQLTYLQVIDSHHLAADPRNVRTRLRDFNRPRGDIVTSDGVIVARSVDTGGELKYQRTYPEGPLFAQVSGYQSFVVGNTGVEAAYDSQLTGRDASLQFSNLGAFLSGSSSTGKVVLSLSKAAQQAAADALGGQRGSVVALDVTTGAVLAMYSNPSYDPSPLAAHETQAVQAAFNGLNADPNNPSLSRAFRERYAPGSTFKLVTAAAALDRGVTTVDRVFPVLTDLVLPQTTKTLRNFGGEACGGTLTEGLVHSCNTTFGELGLELGDQFVSAMGNCGIGSQPPLDIQPGAVSSVGPPPGSFHDNQPLFAFAGIGQGDVAVTPLQMALIGEAIANRGVMLVPHVVDRIEGTDGRVLRTIKPEPWRTCTSPTTAATVTGLMEQVVQRGTGTAAQIPGVTVAGKTGTAQVDTGAPHAWFVAFAPAEQPRYVVAVIVEHGGNAGNEATGGAVAAPVASRVLRTLLGV
jgi:peptidoglycan glycosyltransferase